MFKLYAEWEVHMEDFLGDFESKEAAAAWIDKKDDEPGCPYMGAELVLVNTETKEKWLYTDKWEVLEDDKEAQN